MTLMRRDSLSSLSLVAFLSIFGSGLFLHSLSEKTLLLRLKELQESPEIVYAFANILLLISLVLVFLLFIIQKRRYYVLEIENSSLDEYSLEKHLKAFCKEHTILKNCRLELEVYNNNIEIFADFPKIPLEEQESFLREVQSLLCFHLKSKFKYNKPFILKASFPTTYKNT